jgi:hypothetical protein
MLLLLKISNKLTFNGDMTILPKMAQALVKLGIHAKFINEPDQLSLFLLKESAHWRSFFMNSF